LLVDKEASRSAVLARLGSAGSKDTVVVSFAGHGLRDDEALRLVLSSTSLDDLAGTSLPFVDVTTSCGTCIYLRDRPSAYSDYQCAAYLKDISVARYHDRLCKWTDPDIPTVWLALFIDADLSPKLADPSSVPT
jgi:hypothetical protein